METDSYLHRVRLLSIVFVLCSLTPEYLPEAAERKGEKHSSAWVRSVSSKVHTKRRVYILICRYMPIIGRPFSTLQRQKAGNLKMLKDQKITSFFRQIDIDLFRFFLCFFFLNGSIFKRKGLFLSRSFKTVPLTSYFVLIRKRKESSVKRAARSMMASMRTLATGKKR